jgi:hypothetical protein
LVGRLYGLGYHHAPDVAGLRAALAEDGTSLVRVAFDLAGHRARWAAAPARLANLASVACWR